MVVYRVKYFTDVLCKNSKTTNAFEDFSEVKKKAKELSRLTHRVVDIEWSYSNSSFWALLRSCPTEKDINNAKEKH